MPRTDKPTSQKPQPLPFATAVATFNAIVARIPEMGAADQCTMRAQLHRAEKSIRAKSCTEKMLNNLMQQVEAAITRKAQRHANRPTPTWPEELPIISRRMDIAAAIRDHSVVIIAGETGSGKTTQLPKICLDMGYGVEGSIACTQPRRIAAMTVAQRVADELNTQLGQAVGYRIRFDSRANPDTYISFLTDGLLLSELRSDHLLQKYDCIIVDEAHERSLNIDFLLGCLRDIVTKRPTLRVIVSSATLDVERFSRFFDDAPIIEVSGRTYPVEVRYLPNLGDDTDTPSLEPQQTSTEKISPETNAPEPEGLAEHIGRAVDIISTTDPHGDILVFLVGERDIREVAEFLEKRRLPKTVILPMYARLSGGEQKRVFQKMPERKIVLATNVAETSLTIPGIRYVIDPGTARVKRYNYRTHVELLQTEAISQASANQRTGRCGRVESGVCYRLFNEEHFHARQEFTDPEIQRSSLADVILRMTAFDLGTVEAFPFLDPPNPRMIREGYDTLQELSAIDVNRNLTPIGKKLAHFPLEPRVGRMLLAASEEGSLSEVLLIAGFLSIQDPRERPLDRQGAADSAHQRHQDEHSDFMAVLNLWKWYGEKTAALPSNNRVRAFCKSNFLSWNRMREWADTVRQLEDFADDLSLVHNTTEAPYDAIHRALLAGLLSHIGTLDPERDRPEFIGAYNKRFAVWPGSGLAKKKSRWVMAAEMVETSRLFGRMAARIQPEWIERVAGNLCTKSHSDPFWDERTAHVRAYEQVTLYGLPIVPRRRTHYGPINPPVARDIFIRGALVDGAFKTSCHAILRNQELVASIRELQHKSRRSDLLVDQEMIFAFYDNHLPADIYTGSAFERWYHKAVKRMPDLLLMREEDLMPHAPENITHERFPAILTLEGVEYALDYVFDPGSPEDGVTISIPVASIHNVREWHLDWLVPGLLEEKLNYVIKSLPKGLRRLFVPVPDTVKACLAQMKPWSEPFYPALARWLSERGGERFSSDVFRNDQLPPHLTMRIRVIDDHGAEMATSRVLPELQARFADMARNIFDRFAGNNWQEDNILAWDFGDIPERISIERNGMTVFGYPALVDREDSVGVRLFDNREEADYAHHQGVRRMCALHAPSETRYLQKKLLTDKSHAMHAMPFGGRAAMIEDIILSTMDRLFLQGKPPLRDQHVFENRLRDYTGHICMVGTETGQVVGQILSLAYPIALALEKSASPAHAQGCDEVRAHLQRLVYPGYVGKTPPDVLTHLPRYVRAVALRLERLQFDPYKDRKKAARLTPFLERYLLQEAVNNTLGRHDPELETYRWMLEEFFVSLFAQELGTNGPISEKRLNEQWQLVQTSTRGYT